MRHFLKYLKNYNFIFILGISALIFVFFPSFARAASISGGTCEAPSGQSCSVTITGDLFGYGAADWVGSLWFSDTGLLSPPIVGGGSTFSYNRSILSGASAQVSLVIHGPPPDGWDVQDSSCCGPVTINAVAPNTPPTISALSGNQTPAVGQSNIYSVIASDPDSGATLRYVFNWGDGGTSNRPDPCCSTLYGSGQNVQADHAYSSAGTYTLSVTAYDEKGAASAPSTLVITISSFPAPTITLSGPISGQTLGSGYWTNRGGSDGFADILCESSTETNCMRRGAGWGISNAMPNAVIEWISGHDTNPTSPNLPAWGPGFTSGTTGPNNGQPSGGFQECAPGASCNTDWKVGRWITKVKIPSGTGVESSNYIQYRIWPAQLKFMAAIETYVNNQESLVSINDGFVSLTPNNIQTTAFSSYKTDGLVWNVYPKDNFTAGIAGNLPGIISGSTSIYRNGAAVAVTDNNGVNLSDTANGGTGTPLSGAMSVDRINFFLDQHLFIVPTFTFRSKDTRILIKATLNSNPWSGTLNKNYDIRATDGSSTNCNVTSGQFEKRLAGCLIEKTYSLIYPSDTSGLDGGPNSSRLASITIKNYLAAYPNDNLDISNTTNCSGNSCNASIRMDYGNKKEYILNFVSRQPTLALIPNSMNLTVGGETGDFTLTYDPDGSGAQATQTVCSNNSCPLSGSTWSSNNTSVVTISQIGRATPGIAGTATITATYSSLTATATVFVGAVSPTLSVLPTTLNFSGTQGGTNPSPQNVSISNTGGSGTSLNWIAAENTPWLWLSAPTSGTLGGGSSTAMAINVDTTGLAAGSYSAPVTVSCTTVCAGSPRTVIVNLTVAVPAGPLIALSCTNNCNFSATESGPNPSDQTLSIANSGSNTLIWNASDNASWLTLGTISGSTAAGITSNVPVSVNISGLPNGTYNALITVSGTAGNSPQTQNVTLTIGTLSGPQAVIECNDQPAPPDCIINQGESIEFLNKSTP